MNNLILRIALIISIFTLPTVSQAAEFRFVFDGLLDTNPSIVADVDATSGTLQGSKEYELRGNSYTFTFDGAVAQNTKVLSGDFVYTVDSSAQGGRKYVTKGAVSLNPTAQLLEGGKMEIGKVWEGNYSVSDSARTGAVFVSLIKGDLSFDSRPGDDVLPVLTVSAIRGEVMILRADGSEEVLSENSLLSNGDSILSGYDGFVSIKVGDIGELAIPSLTNVRLDSLEQSDDLVRLQAYLSMGAIRARIKENASIRSDFSVSSPGATASIRGSEMIFEYDNETGISSLFVTEDMAFIKSTEDGSPEVEIAEGNVVHTENNQLSVARYFTEDELKNTGIAVKEANKNILVIAIALLVLILMLFVAMKNKRVRK